MSKTPFKISEFREYLRIDKNALDDCVLEQPILYDKVAQAHVAAKDLVDTINEELKQLEATLTRDISRQLAAESKHKPSDRVIAAHVTRDPERVKLMRELLDAKYQANRLDALKDSYSQRNYMLRELVQLHASGYFTASATIRAGGGEDSAGLKKARARMRDERNRRKASEE